MKDRKLYQIVRNTSKKDIRSYCMKLSYGSIMLGIVSISIWTYYEFNEIITSSFWSLLEIFTSGFIEAGSILLGLGLLFLFIGDLIETSEEE